MNKKTLTVKTNCEKQTHLGGGRLDETAKGRCGTRIGPGVTTRVSSSLTFYAMRWYHAPHNRCVGVFTRVGTGRRFRQFIIRTGHGVAPFP